MKRIKVCFLIIFFIWCFLPSTIFYGKFNKVYERVSDDGNYKVDIYRMKPISPYSVYKIFRGEYYFFVLYNKCDDVIFKPSFFYGTWDMGAVDGIFFALSHNKLKLIYAGSTSLDGDDGGIVEINSDKKLACH